MRTATCTLLVALLLTSVSGLAFADQLQPLLNDLKSSDTKTTLKAIKGLGESGDIRAVPPLLDALRDKRGVVRQYAAEALQNLARSLDEMYVVVKRWLQSLINNLRLDPTDEVIAVEHPVIDLCVALLGRAALGANNGSRACASR
jgi:HEAT repeat protein